jgi:hypothetical protein
VGFGGDGGGGGKSAALAPNLTMDYFCDLPEVPVTTVPLDHDFRGGVVSHLVQHERDLPVVPEDFHFGTNKREHTHKLDHKLSVKQHLADLRGEMALMKSTDKMMALSNKLPATHHRTSVLHTPLVMMHNHDHREMQARRLPSEHVNSPSPVSEHGKTRAALCHENSHVESRLVVRETYELGEHTLTNWPVLFSPQRNQLDGLVCHMRVGGELVVLPDFEDPEMYQRGGLFGPPADAGNDVRIPKKRKSKKKDHHKSALDKTKTTDNDVLNETVEKQMKLDETSISGVTKVVKSRLRHLAS